MTKILTMILFAGMTVVGRIRAVFGLRYLDQGKAENGSYWRPYKGADTDSTSQF